LTTLSECVFHFCFLLFFFQIIFLQFLCRYRDLSVLWVLILKIINMIADLTLLDATVLVLFVIEMTIHYLYLDASLLLVDHIFCVKSEYVVIFSLWFFFHTCAVHILEFASILSNTPKSICFLTFHWFRAVALNSPAIILDFSSQIPKSLYKSDFYWSGLVYKPRQRQFQVTN
jgi:hypothetical protein